MSNGEIIIEWCEKKNKLLKRERGVSFGMVALMLEKDDYLDNISHPNVEKYPNQRIYIMKINGYVYAVPFVKDDKKFFLKTIIPSRKYTKLYLKQDYGKSKRHKKI